MSFKSRPINKTLSMRAAPLSSQTSARSQLFYFISRAPMIKNWCAAPFDCAEIVGHGWLISAPVESKTTYRLISGAVALNIICRTTGGNEVAPKGVADWRQSARLRIRLFALAQNFMARRATSIYRKSEKLTLCCSHAFHVLTPFFHQRERVHLIWSAGLLFNFCVMRFSISSCLTINKFTKYSFEKY